VIRTERYRAEHVDEVPYPLDPGTLYVCEPQGRATHVCACGCEGLAATMINTHGWTLSLDEDRPTIAPSILNSPCGAHYFIRDGAVVWA
jgi:hypothetical protein